jgi:hypothetical protein
MELVVGADLLQLRVGIYQRPPKNNSPGSSLQSQHKNRIDTLTLNP